jgi:hypothetical protein
MIGGRVHDGLGAETWGNVTTVLYRTDRIPKSQKFRKLNNVKRRFEESGHVGLAEGTRVLFAIAIYPCGFLVTFFETEEWQGREETTIRLSGISQIVVYAVVSAYF